ncbi:MAG: hypothetical protein Q8M56_01950 [Desulfobacterales bacterium]|nr:hypothetical protein [Desulfobacterales bacterium]
MFLSERPMSLAAIKCAAKVPVGCVEKLVEKLHDFPSLFIKSRFAVDTVIQHLSHGNMRV